jgi:hypothetical protein
MPTYEIINPHDPYTIQGEPKMVALAVLLLGNGQYAVKGNDRAENVFPIFLFDDGTGTADWLATTFKMECTKETVGRCLKELVQTYHIEVADALDSVMSFGLKERFAYNEAMRMLDGEGREAYKAIVHDKNRSSLTDLGTRAWVMAKAIRKMETPPTPRPGVDIGTIITS